MVRRPPRFPFVLTGVGAGAVYAALLARALLIDSAGWEDNLREWLFEHTERLQFAMNDLLALGGKGGPLLLAILVLALLATRHRREGFFLLAAAGGAGVLGEAAKVVDGFVWAGARDFPSGHAAGSAGAVAAVILLLQNRPRVLLLVLSGLAFVALYGFVLVATDWHSPSEVVGGWCLALAWASSVWLAIGSARFRIRRLPLPATDQHRRPRWDSRQERRLEPRA